MKIIEYYKWGLLVIPQAVFFRIINSMQKSYVII